MITMGVTDEFTESNKEKLYRTQRDEARVDVKILSEKLLRNESAQNRDGQDFKTPGPANLGGYDFSPE